MEKGGKLRDVCEQAGSDTIPVATNDLDYEDKQKQQDSHLVYEGLHFNLADESSKTIANTHAPANTFTLCSVNDGVCLCVSSERHQPLDRALAEWASLLQNQKVPSVRNPIQTCSSIGLTAALYKLLGKVTTSTFF